MDGLDTINGYNFLESIREHMDYKRGLKYLSSEKVKESVDKVRKRLLQDGLANGIYSKYNSETLSSFTPSHKALTTLYRFEWVGDRFEYFKKGRSPFVEIKLYKQEGATIYLIYCDRLYRIMTSDFGDDFFIRGSDGKYIEVCKSMDFPRGSTHVYASLNEKHCKYNKSNLFPFDSVRCKDLHYALSVEYDSSKDSSDYELDLEKKKHEAITPIFLSSLTIFSPLKIIKKKNHIFKAGDEFDPLLKFMGIEDNCVKIIYKNKEFNIDLCKGRDGEYLFKTTPSDLIRVTYPGETIDRYFEPIESSDL